MDDKLLYQLGLTKGEVRVYKALLILKKSSSGNIMKGSNISSSKIYLILDKLIKKGFVSYIIENNIKIFQVANPNNIFLYINKKESEVQSLKANAKLFIADVSNILDKDYDPESAQLFKGYNGLTTVFNNMLLDLCSTDELLFFGVNELEFNDRSKLFFDNFHIKRIEKKIKARGIFHTNLIGHKNLFSKRKLYKCKFSNITYPSSLIIIKNKIILPFFGEFPFIIVINSKFVSNLYRDFFNNLWSSIK